MPRHKGSNKTKGNLEIPFDEFLQKYKDDIYPKLKESTIRTKDAVIDVHITPFFKDMYVCDIEPVDILHWQNELIKTTNKVSGKTYSPSYLKYLNSQLIGIFSHAVRFYGLGENPATKAGSIGSKKTKEMNFWTRDEYLRFRKEIKEEPLITCVFDTLYWTGMRIGELRALTLKDIDTDGNTINIDKTHYEGRKGGTVTTPKTAGSLRKVTIPQFLSDELKSYICSLKEISLNDIVFPVTRFKVSNAIRKYSEKAGVKRIRIHDLRHSHVSLLINMGYSVVAIGKRVGHSSDRITYNYAHMYPSVQEGIAKDLDKLNDGDLL